MDIPILNTVFDGLLCPVALLYMFLLDHEWRGGWLGKAAALVLSSAACLLLSKFFGTFAPQLRVLSVILPLLAAVSILSRIHDARRLFVFLTGLLFTCASLAESVMLAHRFGVHPLFVRVALDALGFLFALFLLAPIFKRAFYSVRTGWLISNLLPFSICIVYVALWDYWHMPAVLLASPLHVFSSMLGVFTPLTYVVLFRFILEQQAQSETAISHFFLGFQFDTLVWQVQRREKQALAGRILRHDLRHYVPLLRASLGQGDDSGARDIIASMHQLLQRHSPEEETVPSTGEPAIDVVLDFFAGQAEAQGIPLIICLSLSETPALDPVVISAFLAAALDDALRGCALPGNAFRCIEIFSEGGGENFEMRVASTYSGTVSFDAATGFPRMRDVESAFPSNAVMLFLLRGGAELSLSPRKGWFDLCLRCRKGGLRP